MNIFDKLNTPKAVIAILVVIVAVNGFILFQQRGNDEPSSTETAQNAPTNNENNGSNSSNSSDTNDSADTENDADSQDTADSGDSEAANEEAGDEPGGDEPEQAEQEEQAEQQAEESGSSEQSEGDQAPEQAEQEDSQPSDESSSNEGSSDEEQVEQDESRQELPQQDDPELLLAGLGGAFGDCDTDPEDCVRSYMSSNISDSRFLGGRVDLAAAPQSANSEVLYFESSELGVCEFEREIYESPEGQNYIVILLGEGSVQSEEGNECIPTA